MKKRTGKSGLKKWLAGVKYAVLSVFLLTVITTSVVGSTFAKYVTEISSSGQIQAAGFMVGAGVITNEQTIANASLAIEPEVEETIYASLNYFSQTNTQITLTNSSGVTGYGTLAEISDSNGDIKAAAITEYRQYLQDEMGYTAVEAAAAIVPTSLDEMFSVEIKSGGNKGYGDTVNEQVADLLRTTGNLTGRGMYVGAMSYDAHSYVTLNLEMLVTWETVTNDWDTFVGEKIAARLDANANDKSGINMVIGLRVEQYPGEVPTLTSLANTKWLIHSTVDMTSISGKTYNIDFMSNGNAFKGINFNNNIITYIPQTGSNVSAYNAGTWSNANYKTIEILSGNSVKSMQLMTFLESFGTQDGEASRIAQAVVVGIGEYPQTYVGDKLNAELIRLVNDGTLTANAKTYTIDVQNSTVVCPEYTYNGQKYVKIASAQPYETSYTFSNGTFITKGATYFFKVEPIQMIHVDQNLNRYSGETILMAKYLLGSKRFDASSTSWETSAIRTYLNSTFATDTGLGTLAKQITIGNNVAGNYGSASSDSSGTPTQDKLWYPSYYEISQWITTQEERKANITDFALASKTYLNVTSNTGYYYLRSTGASASSVCYVYSAGYVSNSIGPTFGDSGIRPAFALA